MPAKMWAVVLAFGVSAVAFAADEKPALAGKYDCKGDGYKGTVTITADGAAYKVAWSVGDTYTGIGLWENDRLSVAWQTKGGSSLGISVYKREKDGTLKGKWILSGSDTTSEETLTPQKK